MAKKKTEEVPAELSGEQKPQEQEAEQKPTHVTIMIPSSSDFDGKDDVFVSVNGKDYLLQRDVEVTVPIAVANVLRDAKKTVHDTDQHGRIVSSREVARFPFQTIK